MQEVRKNAQLRSEFRQVERERYEKTRETRALSVGVTTAGGFSVPDEMMRALEESLLQWGGMRQAATVITTATGADLPIPTVDDTAQKGVILAENTGAATQDVVFAQKVMKAFKYSSKMIQVSVELLQDTSINLPQYLGSALGTRIGRITNDHFTTGAGTTEPWGVVTRATTSGVTVASAGVMIFSEPLRLLHSVDPAYRQGASFMCHDSTFLKLRQMVDGQARPIWEPSLQAGQPGSLYGYPVLINQSMAAYAAAAKVALFGQFSKYLIRDVRSIEIMRLDERYAEAHQVAFLGFSRHDGDLLDAGTDPVKFMTGL
jgi:HK97 family phage major capsid protein